MKMTVKTKRGVQHFNRAGFRFDINEREVEVDEDQAAKIAECEMLEVVKGGPSKTKSAPKASEADSEPDLEDLKFDELKELAGEKGVETTGMRSKAEVREAIEKS